MQRLRLFRKQKWLQRLFVVSCATIILLPEGAAASVAEEISITDSNLETEIEEDTESPDNLRIQYDQNEVQGFWNQIFYFREKVTATLYAEDVGSGIDYFVYSYDEEVHVVRENRLKRDENHAAYFTFHIPAEFQGKISFSVYDKAGNCANYIGEERVIADSIHPSVTIRYTTEHAGCVDLLELSDGGFHRVGLDEVSKDTRYLYAEPVTMTVSIAEENFYEEDVSISVTQNSQVCSEFSEVAWERQLDACEYTTELRMEEDGDYCVNIQYTDRSGNDAIYQEGSITETEEMPQTATYQSHIISIDTTDPLGMIQLPAGAYVEYQKDEQGEITGKTSYYHETVDAKAVIQEAYFIPEECVLYVNDEAIEWVEWKWEDHQWCCQFPFLADGANKIRIEYTDPAGHEVRTRDVGEVIIDREAPEIQIQMPEEKGEWKNGVMYYRDSVTAQIDIKETYFRPENVTVWIELKDYTGEVIEPKEDTSLYQQAYSWTEEKDMHSASLNFHREGVYTYQIICKDLAGNQTEVQETGTFVVDRTPPELKMIGYSNGVILEEAQGSMLYAREPVAFQMETEDEISGIDYMVCKYLDEESREKERIISEEDMENQGKIWIGQITLPEQDVQDNIQLNTPLYFELYDKAGNRYVTQNRELLIYDTISPQLAFSYSQPEGMVDDTRYYQQAAEVFLQVTEKNFRAEDMKVSLLQYENAGQDLVASEDISLEWNSQTEDSYTGYLRIQKPGEYSLHVSYRDPSGNQMEDMDTQHLVIDPSPPDMILTGISHHTATREPQISFQIYFADREDHLDADGIEATLWRITRDVAGKYEKSEVSLPDPVPYVPQKEMDEISSLAYEIQVDNLLEDGVYMLQCSARDYAGNVNRRITDSQGNSQETILFSVNRNGSTFYLDDQTEQLVQQRYVYRVNHDVVIREVNVDAVTEAFITVNGIRLDPVNYDITTERGENSWCEQTYKIHQDVFSKEGEYNVAVSSRDNTGTVVYSDLKDLYIDYVVDQTEPDVMVSGLKSESSYHGRDHTFYIMPSDTGGRLKNLQVFLKQNHQILCSYSNENDDELDEYLNSHEGKISCDIPEGTDQEIVILCGDYAKKDNQETNVARLEYEHVSVGMKQMRFLSQVQDRTGHVLPVIIIAAGACTGILIFWKVGKNRNRR